MSEISKKFMSILKNENVESLYHEKAIDILNSKIASIRLAEICLVEDSHFSYPYIVNGKMINQPLEQEEFYEVLKDYLAKGITTPYLYISYNNDRDIYYLLIFD